MVLGMTYPELFIVIGIGAAMFGTRDLPKVGRAAGRIAGWAAGYMLKARGHFQMLTGGSQLAQMHRELQESMYELQRIRDELRMGAAFLRPGTVVHNTRTTPGKSPSEDLPASQTASDLGAMADGKQNGQAQLQQQDEGMGFQSGGSSGEDDSKVRLQHLIATMGMDAAIAAKARLSSATDRDCGAGHDWARVAGGEQNGNGTSPGMLGKDVNRGMGQGMPDQVSPLPISAVSAGLVQSQGAQFRRGADIMVDALMEEDVAKMAQTFVESQNGNGDTART